MILTLGVVFVLLGLWQLDRHRERIESNETIAARLQEPPVSLDILLAEAGEDLSSIEYRRATFTGIFAPADEVLIRSQVHLGAGGFHVVTPLVGEGGAVLVNRGWVPISMDRVPVEHAPPPAGQEEIEGWVRLSQERPALGSQDPATGRLEIMSRIDIPRISAQVNHPLAPVYIVMTGGEEGLPESVRLPSFNENGPHLGYAIQWFGFALVGLVGYLLLVRRRLAQTGGRARPSTTS